ncbi:MAG: bifunctional phosphopantothenoylcysteine decarboxylase/phosphopantothenate--cysteine ligase CoaBC [bacterium]
MNESLHSRILLGVTGSVAAFKTPELVRELRDRAADVSVVRTAAAAKFVGDAALEAMTGNPVAHELFDPRGLAALPFWLRGGASEREPYHLALAEGVDLLAVVPATASMLGKMAHGIADDLLSTLLLATTRPIVVAPAMNPRMWEHEATQANVASLSERGVRVLFPESGKMAWDTEGTGAGRLPEPPEIAERLLAHLATARQLRGQKVVVSAGGTEEPVDAVRVLGNRSSGRMGVALAEEARARGADVVLVAAATSVPLPAGMRIVRARTAAAMKEAMLAESADADVVLMAAAVADWRPASPAPGKVKKSTGPPEIRLEPTDDILLALRDAGTRAFRVGFALETDDAVANGRRKLAEKDLDLLVVNDATEPGAGFEVATNRVTMIARGGQATDVPLLSKPRVAIRIFDRVAELRAGHA